MHTHICKWYVEAELDYIGGFLFQTGKCIDDWDSALQGNSKLITRAPDFSKQAP